MEILLAVLAFLGLVIGSYTDFKTREVPDWVNRGLLATGLGLHLLLSIVYWDWNPIFLSLSGFIVLFLLALLMYYTGQWGGGDSKMLIALGAIIGLDVLNFSVRDSFLLGFVFNSLVAGACYGLIWSVFLSIKKRKAFVKEFKRIIHKKQMVYLKIALLLMLGLLLILIIFVQVNMFRIFFAFIGIFLGILFYIWVYIKAVEHSSMLKYMVPDKLTEGDWIAKDVKVKGKVIVGPKDLGVEKKQIKKLIALYKQRKIRKVLVKEGIPFVPSFLIAFVVTYLFGNLLFIIL